MEKAIRRAKKEGKIAKTAQQTIPYEEMYPDGICRITNRLYSKSVLCDDINYAEASDDEKAVLFELYCKLVNYFGPSVGFELSVICYPADLVEYRKMLALNPQGDQFDEIRKEYSDMLVRQVSKSRYERRICLTYTIEADGIRQARSRLEQIDNDVVGHFRALTVAAHPMDGYERLTILHRCLHLEENRKFRFNWDSLKHTGLSSKDYIAPSSFFFKDGRYFRSGASFGAVSFLQIRATKLYDTLLNSILNMEGSQIVSIHAKALDQNAALKAVKRKLSDLDKAKIDEQKRAVRSGFDMDILPPDLVTFGKEAQKLLEDLQNHDEKMFMVTILVVHAASSRQKLENLIYSANGITNTQNCDLIRLDYQQEQGFVSALPIGINQVEIQRGLTTSGTAIFLPFRACEVFQPKGVYYGLNATTNRMILADRKTLKCPNGVVLGTPGSGKSFSCKREAADVYLHTTDDILFFATLKKKPEDDSKDEDAKALPPLAEGQTFEKVEASTKEGTTSPPRHFTEDLLLSAMEHASAEEFAEIEGAERTGLGTPATRAGVLEKLVRGGFLERKGRQLLPTKKGFNLIVVLPDSVKSARLTAQWEAGLKSVERGEQAPDAFMGGIEQMVSDLVAQYSAVKADTSLFQQREVIGKCPRCGSDVLEGKKNFFCSNRECQFSMWKDDRFFTSKHKELTKPMAAALLKNGRIKMKGLFSEKKGVLYDAVVVLADTGEKYVNYKIELSPRPKTKGKE